MEKVQSLSSTFMPNTVNTGWRTKCHTIDCAHSTFLLLQKHLTFGTELILIGWKIVPNEEHVQCDHCFASQPLANEPLHSSQLHYVGPELHYIFWPPNGMTFRVPPCMFHISAHSASRQAP